MVNVVLLMNSCENDVSNKIYHLNTNAVAEYLECIWILLILLKTEDTIIIKKKN